MAGHRERTAVSRRGEAREIEQAVGEHGLDAGVGQAGLAGQQSLRAELDLCVEAPQGGKVDRLIAKYAAYYEVPESLVRRVVKRESNFNPAARNGPYWGLMQILHQTARGMGYSGSAQGLLDAETNLKYAVRYLRGAWLVADGDHDRAVRFYARGYYYDAKRRGMLEATGLGKDRKRKRRPSNV